MSQGMVNSPGMTYPLGVALGGTGQTSSTGTGVLVQQTSPIILTPNITGVTNASSAAGGSIGEVMSGTILNSAGLAMTTVTAKNLFALTFQPGDWDLTAMVGFNFSSIAGGAAIGWISLTSATQPDYALQVGRQPNSGVEAIVGYALPVFRVNVSVATTVYVSGFCAFSAGSCTMMGSYYARRMR